MGTWLGIPLPLAGLARPSEAVRNFTPSWFTVVMSCGIVGYLIGKFPYDTPAQLEVGWAFWWLTVVLFCTFSIMLASRFIFFRADGMKLFTHPVQAMFLGAIPPALGTIVNGLPLFLAHYWEGEAVMRAAVVLWWVQCALALACTLLLPFYMFTHHSFRLESITAVWLLPILPCVVAAASGGTVARAPDTAVGAARVIVYASYMLWGIGVPLCFIIMVIYFRRLLLHSLPPKELIVSSFLPVGPMGMGAVGLLNLGAALVRCYPPPDTAAQAAAVFTPGSAPTDAQLQQIVTNNLGPLANTLGTLIAVVMWGLGIWWLTVAVASVTSVFRQMSFNIGWWGFVFPLGVFSLAADELWRRAPSLMPLRVVSAILICCVVLLWCICFVYTVRVGWSGALFHAPCLHTSPKPGDPIGRDPGMALGAADIMKTSSGGLEPQAGQERQVGVVTGGGCSLDPLPGTQGNGLMQRQHSRSGVAGAADGSAV